MLYREIIAVCSEIHTEHITTLCGQNALFLVKRRRILGIKRIYIKFKFNFIYHKYFQTQLDALPTQKKRWSICLPLASHGLVMASHISFPDFLTR